MGRKPARGENWGRCLTLHLACPASISLGMVAMQFGRSPSRILKIQRVVYSTCGSPACLAGPAERWYRAPMTQLAQKLDKKLATWRPEVAAQVEQIVTDVIELADTDTLDLLPSRAVVQEVLDTLDERQTG